MNPNPIYPIDKLSAKGLAEVINTLRTAPGSITLCDGAVISIQLAENLAGLAEEYQVSIFIYVFQ